jgi:hypothetical protein
MRRLNDLLAKPTMAGTKGPWMGSALTTSGTLVKSLIP